MYKYLDKNLFGVSGYLGGLSERYKTVFQKLGSKKYFQFVFFYV